MAGSSFDEGKALTRSLATLAKLGVVPRIAATLDKAAGDVARRLQNAIVAEIPAFTA